MRARPIKTTVHQFQKHHLCSMYVHTYLFCLSYHLPPLTLKYHLTFALAYGECICISGTSYDYDVLLYKSCLLANEIEVSNGIRETCTINDDKFLFNGKREKKKI